MRDGARTADANETKRHTLKGAPGAAANQSRPLRWRRREGKRVIKGRFPAVVPMFCGTAQRRNCRTRACIPDLTIEQLHAIADNINGGVTAVVITDAAPRFLFANDRYFEQLGFTREQFRKEVPDAFTLVHPEDRERVIDETRKASQEQRPFSVVYRVIRRDGSLRWIQSNISIIAFPDIAEPVQLSVANDITVQREVEERLAKTSGQLKAIMDNVNGGVSAAIFSGENVEYVFINDAYCSLLGYTKEQFESELPRGAMDAIFPDDLPAVFQSARESEETGRPTSIEVRATKRDGSLIWLRRNSSICSFAGIEGKVHIAVSTDITKEKEAERKIKEYADQLKLLTENVPGGIAVFSVQNGELSIEYCNDGFYAFSGYSREEYLHMVEQNPLSLVFEEDRPGIYQTIGSIHDVGEDLYCSYRRYRKDGSYRWFDLKGSVVEKRGEALIIHVVQFDVTERREAEEKLRMSEEQFRIASAIGGRAIARYDIKTSQYYHDDALLYGMGFDSPIENVPQSFLNAGYIAPDSIAPYAAFFDSIRGGEKSCAVDMALKMPDGQYRWFHGEATVIFDAEEQPSQAIIVTTDITQQREKEAVYQRWQQSLQQKPPGSYTLYRSNLNKGSPFDTSEGSLLTLEFSPEAVTFDQRSQEYAERYVHYEDRERYLEILNSDTLLANYYRGKRIEVLEYREFLAEGGVRWLRLTIELVQYPNSTDVEAYLMYENIDSAKKAELNTKAMSETDPLTGVLNRMTFARKMGRLIQKNSAGRHTLLMLDIDGFKLLNDTFGHVAGDQALIDIANSLRSILRQGDLIGRLGGDEFLICLKDIPYDAVVEKKARQICSLVRKSYSLDVQISASVGIAIYPGDGEDFDTLYKNADKTLYRVKERGKDNYAFFNREIGEALARNAQQLQDRTQGRSSTESKRRMLIVDDNEINRRLLTRIFQDEFIIETAADGNAALLRLRHYKTGISVVLLDLVMPGLDGFGVLEKMRANMEMRTIPVVVVSGQDERETSLKAIKYGASDYVTKPVDLDLIRLRVHSAVSRAENERLRAQNSYLLLQSSEEAKYRSVLESTGTVVIEYDWINGVFTYDPSISKYIAGDYDNRKLWHILLSDMVADVMDVKRMQDLVYSLANSKLCDRSSMDILLRAPSGDKRWFRMSAYKQMDEFQLTDKMILTFVDVNEETLAGEKLRFQAERDNLTGLYNRRTFLRKVEEMVYTAPKNTYLMSVGDVDNFKMINDRYGHAEGDKLLRFIADTIQADVNKAGGICGRLGGDVFATLLSNTPGTLERTANYPRELLAGYSMELETTCSIGYYIIDNPNMSAEVMLDRASMAKQTVKKNYSKKVAWYDETMRKALLMEQEIAGSMESALAEGLFDIYLQPQFNHVTGQICGAEALVRWLHPEKGVMFFPGEFIPLFERNGFITKLDEYVWRRTAERFHEWQRAGRRPVPVSVNVSRLDTHDPQLCEKLLRILKQYDIPIDLFRLEITESLFEKDSERLIQVIDKLHAAGFMIEMDDFGSGYSSLNILKDVPVDILKLDIRFFSGTDNNSRSGMILNAVMRMARWLNIQVIAEGVEEKAQADYLASIGCPVVQGYLYAAPMPVAEFEKLLEEDAAPAASKAMQWDPTSEGGSLWAPGALDSTLFFNYMEAAMIFEYRDGAFEPLRANKRFIDLMGFNENFPMPHEKPVGMHEEDIPFFYAAAKRCVEKGGVETLFVRRSYDDSGEQMHLRCTLCRLPGESEDATVLCTVEKVSEQ